MRRRILPWSSLVAFATTHVRADRDDDDVAFAEAGLLQDARLGRVALEGRHVFARLLHGGAVPVDEDHFRARVRERLRERQPEAPRADDSDSLHSG